MNNNRFKWQRRDGAWHLWRGAYTTDGATLWQETGYVVHSERNGHAWIEKPNHDAVMGGMLVREAKAYAENLAANLARNSR